MKKLTSLLLVWAVLLTATACAQSDFAAEYAALNGQTTSDGLHAYAEVSLPEDDAFAYAAYEDVISLLEGGTGVVYLGFPQCPWCRCLVPALQEAHARTGAQDSILCFNALEMRDVRSLAEDGTIVVEKEAAPEYDRLVSLLYDELGPYEGLNDPSIRRIYFPTTVFVRDGQIVSLHVATLDAQADPYVPLSPSLYEELVSQLAEAYRAIL